MPTPPKKKKKKGIKKTVEKAKKGTKAPPFTKKK